MRSSTWLIAVLGILAAASAVESNHGPPSVASTVQNDERSFTPSVSFPTLAVYQQDLAFTDQVSVTGVSPAALPSVEAKASVMVLAERRDGALDLVSSASHFAQTTMSQGVDTSKRLGTTLGDSGRIPLRI